MCNLLFLTVRIHEIQAYRADPAFANQLLHMHELQTLESFLDVGVLVAETPDQLAGVVLEHQQNEAFVDAEIALSDPGLIAFGLGGITKRGYKNSEGATQGTL